jgi:hypothetical protein
MKFHIDAATRHGTHLAKSGAYGSALSRAEAQR